MINKKYLIPYDVLVDENGPRSGAVTFISRLKELGIPYVIITEQGVADLRWKTPQQRAEAIIENCAHPDYRPLLREYFEHAKKVADSQHTPHDLKLALSWHQRFLETGSMKP